MKDNDIPYVAGMFCLSHRNNTNEMQKYELPELPELPETGNIPYDNASDERLLSDEIRKAFGVDFPNIDHFQTARSVIEIPEEIISKIIRKGNSMKLVGSTFFKGEGIASSFDMTFFKGEGIASSFDMTLRMLPMGVDEITDCIVGIFLGKNVTVTHSEIESFISHLTKLPLCVNTIWGLYIDETLEPAQAQVITVATTENLK